VQVYQIHVYAGQVIHDAIELLPCPFRDDQYSAMGVALRVFFAKACPAMKLSEICRAVDEGLMVHWQNREYQVVRSSMHPSYLIRSTATGHCIGLTWADGVTLNGKEEDFFIGDSALT
jgi:hypothetical protein